MDNNTQLAEVYSKNFHQMIIIFPLVWKHVPGGDWFLYHVIKE